MLIGLYYIGYLLNKFSKRGSFFFLPYIGNLIEMGYIIFKFSSIFVKILIFSRVSEIINFVFLEIQKRLKTSNKIIRKMFKTFSFSF